jgi:hypothetical protein
MVRNMGISFSRIFAKQTRMVLLASAVSMALVSVPVSAHHGNAAYDLDKTVTLKVTITGFEFGNPHVQVFFDTKDDRGNILHWNCEGTNPAMLSRIGWTRNTLKAGDQVTVVVHPNKNPDVTVVGLVKVILANGQVLESRNPV